MLTDETILKAINRGVLHAYDWPGVHRRDRVFLMSTGLKSILAKAEAGKVYIYDYAEVVGDIRSYIKGDFMNIPALKPLQPVEEEIWALRSTRPSPQLRTFGRFAQPDVFVASHVFDRLSLENHGWDFQKTVCEDYWSKTFGFDDPPFTSTHYHHYVTANSERKQIR